MDTIREDIVAAHIRPIPDFPKPGILFRDITPLLESPVAFRRSIDRFAERYADKGLDRIAAIEARGFLFGAALADRLGVGLTIVRKPGKLPHETVRKDYALEYGTDAVEMHIDSVQSDHRVLVIDDLLATGGTAGATIDLIQSQGAEIVEAAFVVELGALNGREKLGDVPVFALVAF